MFGLVNSETVSGYWGLNNRRRILYDYPNGSAPLTALLSMMDVESTPYPEFKWEEKRWNCPKTITATGPSSGVWLTLAGSTTTAGSPATITAGEMVRVYVADASDFQADDQALIPKLNLTSGTADLIGVVSSTNKDTSPYWIEMRVTAAPASTVINTGNNAAGNIGNYVVLTGSAYAEGSRSRQGRYKFPYDVENYTQIHKTPFEMSRTALKEPAKWDKQGFYRDMYKENAINHLAGLEWTSFFGRKGKTTVSDPDTGTTVSKRTSGGIRYFLDLYENGGSSASDYGGGTLSDIHASDWRTTPAKRVIKLGSASITQADFEDLNTRVFDKCYSSDWSKLCLCGNGYLSKIQAAFKSDISFTSMRDEGYDGFDFQVKRHSNIAGTVYYKSHPLFNDPSMTFMRNSAFYLDLGCMKWRPLTDSDTDVQRMIQANDADKRKDQWLTEGGTEFWYPDAMMYVEDLGGITK